MTTARYVRWQDGDMWLGYFEQFPDYLTQGESLSARARASWKRTFVICTGT
ncbi:MAG TPA: hypothetical protein VMH80_15195 [Bryobacteraceae bacterium]|nr:hypothetical protein [Bryobacteraceae bacterium]